MSILSKELSAKLLGSEWSFGYNCYEVGHTWDPSCTAAALEISLAAALKVFPLYGALYSFSQLAVQRRYDLDATWDTTKSVLRSSFFIFFHAYNGSLLGCALRAGFGRFYYRVLVCAPALLSSYFSLLIEKPSRRQALAFYLLNMASEIVYRMMVIKGYFKPIRYGETILFAFSLAAWYHIIKTEGFGHDPVSGAMKALIGRDEAKSRSSKGASTQLIGFTTRRKNNDNDGNDDNTHNDDKHHEELARFQETTVANKWWLENILEGAFKRIAMDNDHALQLFPCKHPTCSHKEASCFEYVLAPLPSRFLVGYGIQSILSLARNPLELIRSPLSYVLNSLSSKQSVKFGLFIASLVSAGRATSCLLRHYTNSDRAEHAALAGFVAGLTMLWAPRSSLSMYVMWKAVEQYYLLAARQGKVKYVDFTVLSIYSISATMILYTFALEPKFIRPSYMKFLDNVSDHRLHQLNRMVLDVFGTGSSVGYEDYFPDLDPRLMSNQFKELIFNWMIQPYE